VPSACNSQIIKVYAVLETGAYKYIEPEHKLTQLSNEDIRGNLGTQKMMKCAQFGLIYVADFNKNTGIIKSDYGKKMFVAGTETGLMSQNVYLFCASAKLNTVLIALTDRDYLAGALKLDESSEVIYAQIVGNEV